MESALTGVGLLTAATGAGPAGGLRLLLEFRQPGAFDMSSAPGPRGAVKPLNVSIFSPAPQLTMLPGILNVLNGLKSFSAELGWLVGIRAGPDPPSSFPQTWWTDMDEAPVLKQRFREWAALPGSTRVLAEWFRLVVLV